MATTKPVDYLHRDVYRDHHGPIPDGYHVHHVDHDPDNNDPSNLAVISPSDHARHHGEHQPVYPTACAGCGEVFDANRPWAKWCSARCKERVRRSSGLVKPRPLKGPMAEPRTCEHCGGSYVARKPWQRFCTSAHKQRQLRRDRSAARVAA